MPPRRLQSLRSALVHAAGPRQRHLWAAEASVLLSDLAVGSTLGGDLAGLAGRSVLILTRDQLTAALALIELDGIARRLILCPPDLSAKHLPSVSAAADADAIVSDCEADAIAPDCDSPHLGSCDVPLRVVCSPTVKPAAGLLRG